MLRLMLKHVTVEAAINVLFGVLYNNFVKPRIIVRVLSTKWTLESHQNIISSTSPEIEQQLFKLIKSEVMAEQIVNRVASK